jgi:hypothetical protein
MLANEELNASVAQIENGQYAIEHVIGRYLEQQLIVNGTGNDPMEPMLGPDGGLWDVITGHDTEDWRPYSDEEGLAKARRIGQWLRHCTPFGRSAIENRISYIVGFGHTYNVMERQGEDATDEQKKRVKDWLDTWLELNRWYAKQQENVDRRDTEGEVFIRMFRNEDGYLRLRYIEPGAVYCPADLNGKDECTFGIETDPDDVETVIRYWVNDEPIDADEIQHRKRNAKSTDKRGTPLLWAFRHNIHRAMKTLRNGSTLIEIQTAYAVVKKVAAKVGTTVKAWAQQQANAQVTSQKPGYGNAETNSTFHQKVQPGSMTTIPDTTDIELPGIGADPSKTAGAVQAEGRAVAAAMIMPEYMLTADASNGNFASTMIAEGPAVKNFERLQYDEIKFDLELINKAAEFAVEMNILKAGDLEVLKIEAEPPKLIVRDAMKDAQTRQIDIGAGILSIQTATAESGRDYETEQQNMEAHDESNGVLPTNERPDDFLNDDDEDDPGADGSDGDADSGDDSKDGKASRKSGDDEEDPDSGEPAENDSEGKSKSKPQRKKKPARKR